MEVSTVHKWSANNGSIKTENNLLCFLELSREKSVSLNGYANTETWITTLHLTSKTLGCCCLNNWVKDHISASIVPIWERLLCKNNLFNLLVPLQSDGLLQFKEKGELDFLPPSISLSICKEIIFSVIFVRPARGWMGRQMTWQQSLLRDKTLQPLFRMTLGLCAAELDPFKQPDVVLRAFAFMAGE